MRHTYAHLNKDFNFEFYKGGGAMPPQESEASKAAARIAEAEAAEKRDQLRTEREQKIADRKLKADKQDSARRVGASYDMAVYDGNSRLGAAGLDSSSGYGAEISNLLRSSLNRARASAPDVVTDASSLFSPTAYDDAYSTVRNTARGKLSRSADEFMGDGFDTTMFADTSDDEILRSILGDQKKDATTRIEQARARGQINDVGYERAMKDLASAEHAGFSKANSIGQGVLSGYRKNLSDYAGTQRKRIDNFDFSDNINLDSIRNSLNSKAEGYRGSLQGDILAAIGGTKFFDEDTLLGTATGASGVTNQTVTPTAPGTGLTTQNALSTLYGDRTAQNTTDETKKNTGF